MMYYSDVVTKNMRSLPEVLAQINVATGRRFVIIIDEWDVYFSAFRCYTNGILKIRNTDWHERIQTIWTILLQGTNGWIERPWRITGMRCVYAV